MKLKVKLAQQKWQEELGKLDVAPEEGLKLLQCFLSSAPCFWETAGRMEPVLGVPGSALGYTGQKDRGPGQACTGQRTRHCGNSRVFLGGNIAPLC